MEYRVKKEQNINVIQSVFFENKIVILNILPKTVNKKCIRKIFRIWNQLPKVNIGKK